MRTNMNDQEQHKEYMQLLVDAMNLKYGKSIYTEAKLQERLVNMIKSNNSHATRALSRFINLNSPSAIKPNTIWNGLNDSDVAKGVAKHFWEVVS